MNGSNFLSGQLTGQYHPAKAQRTQPANLLYSTIIGLSGSVERKMRGETKQGHILYQDSIYPSLLELLKKLLGGRELVVINQRIDGNINTRLKLMSILTKLSDVVNAIAYGSTGSETRSTDIDGICAMIDGS